MKKSFIIPFVLFLYCARLAYGESVYIRQIIDGDTIKIQNGSRIRFIGVDTPEIYDGKKILWESKKWKMDLEDIKILGHASKKFLEDIFKKAGNGKRIILKYDRFNVYTDHKDKYGRELAYVYIPLKDEIKEDPSWVCETVNGKRHIFLNATLLREGYAFVYYFSDYELKNDFIAYEKKAREEKKGLWNDGEKGFFAIWPYIKNMRRPSSSGYKAVF